jgi:hypothetical protein
MASRSSRPSTWRYRHQCRQCVVSSLCTCQPRLHLQSYIANYTSHAKIDRLVFIADQSRGKPLELEALRLAIDELRKARTHARRAYARANGTERVW